MLIWLLKISTGLFNFSAGIAQLYCTTIVRFIKLIKILKLFRQVINRPEPTYFADSLWKRFGNIHWERKNNEKLNILSGYFSAYLRIFGIISYSRTRLLTPTDTHLIKLAALPYPFKKLTSTWRIPSQLTEVNGRRC